MANEKHFKLLFFTSNLISANLVYFLKNCKNNHIYPKPQANEKILKIGPSGQKLHMSGPKNNSPKTINK